jgi:hypothetical protein
VDLDPGGAPRSAGAPPFGRLAGLAGFPSSAQGSFGGGRSATVVFGAPIVAPKLAPRPATFPPWGLQGIHATIPGAVRASSSGLSVTTRPFYATSALGGATSTSHESPLLRSRLASRVSHSSVTGDA